MAVSKKIVPGTIVSYTSSVGTLKYGVALSEAEVTAINPFYPGYTGDSVWAVWSVTLEGAIMGHKSPHTFGIGYMPASDVTIVHPVSYSERVLKTRRARLHILE